MVIFTKKIVQCWWIVPRNLFQTRLTVYVN